MAIPDMSTSSLGEGSLGDLINVLQTTYGVADRAISAIHAPTALTASTKPFSIRSKAYVEADISRLEIAANILSVTCSLYGGMIMIALQAQNMISSGVKVGNILNTVSTEALQVYHNASDDFSALSAGLEALNSDSERDRREREQRRRDEREDARRAEDREQKEKDRIRKEEREDRKEAERQRREDEKAAAIVPDPVDNKLGAKDVTLAAPDVLPQGTLLDVTLVGEGKDGSQTSQHVMLAVHMLPFIVQTQAAELILANTAPASFSQRLTQYRAGELRFIKDVIFQADRLKKLETALSTDKEGGYTAYLADAVKKDKSHIRNIFSRIWSGKAMSNNVANSVLIISEDTAAAVKNEHKFDIHSAGQRQQFFKNSYVMMIWVVDQSYERVTLYMNGVDDVGDYSYAQLKPKSKSDTANLVQIMAAMSQNRAPRF